jgi:hypothetical protein
VTPAVGNLSPRRNALHNEAVAFACVRCFTWKDVQRTRDDGYLCVDCRGRAARERKVRKQQERRAAFIHRKSAVCIWCGQEFRPVRHQVFSRRAAG